MVKSFDLILAFFSTCAQIFAALVGVFGMFILYRLQIEENRISYLRERMIAFHESHKKLPLDSVIAALQQLAHEHEQKQEIELSESIHILLRNYSGAVKKQKWLESAAKRPILIMLGLTFLSMLALLIVPAYVTSAKLKIDLLWGTLIVSAVPLWQIGVVVLKSIAMD